MTNKKNYNKSEAIKAFILELSNINPSLYIKSNDSLSLSEKQIVKKNLPTQLLNLNKNNPMYKNYWFNSSNNESIRVNYNQKSKWVSTPSFSQINIDGFLAALEYESNSFTKKDFFKYFEQNGFSKYIDKLFSSLEDTDYYNIISKDLETQHFFTTQNFEWYFDEAKIKTDLLTDRDKSTWYIYVDGLQLVQIQFPVSVNRPKSLISRINMELLYSYYKKIKETNETLGISAEVALCNFYNIDVPKTYINRYDPQMVKNILKDYAEFTKSHNIPKFTEILGHISEGTKKSPTDFKSNEITISIKTNKLNSDKVCPPDSGQPGLSRGVRIYSEIFGVDFDILWPDIEIRNSFNEPLFKELFIKNIDKVVHHQLKNIFSEDYLLHIKETKKGYSFSWIPKLINDYKFSIDKFSFTRMNGEWKESTSIKYNNVSIAEMQLHSKRYFKFRFNMTNLLKVLNR